MGGGEMSWGWALVLGVIQGLTEFLPVSSSGHLVILQGLAGVKTPGVTLEVALHLGTLLAVLVALRSDVAWLWRSCCGPGGREGKEGRRLLWMLAVALVPTGVIGLAGKSFFERAFSSPAAAATALLGTGAVLAFTPVLSRGRTSLSRVRWSQAFCIGVAQGLAIFPGISRSGLTIAAALASGLEPEAAARFSFLLSVPAVLGAAGLDAWGILAEGGMGIPAFSLLAGTAAATVVGVLAVRWMLQLVRHGRLRGFAYYCWLVGALTLIWIYLVT